MARLLIIDPIMAETNSWAAPLRAAGHDIVVLSRQPDLDTQANADFVICPDDLPIDWREAVGRALGRLSRSTGPATEPRPMTPFYAPILTCPLSWSGSARPPYSAKAGHEKTYHGGRLPYPDRP